jgi:hypothetical protein
MVLTFPELPARVPVRVIRASLLGGLLPRRRLRLAIQVWLPPPRHRAGRLMLPQWRRRPVCPARQRPTQQVQPTPRARWADQARSGLTRPARSTTVPVTAIMAKQRQASSCPRRLRKPRAIIPATAKLALANDRGLRRRWRVYAGLNRRQEPRRTSPFFAGMASNLRFG